MEFLEKCKEKVVAFEDAACFDTKMSRWRNESIIKTVMIVWGKVVEVRDVRNDINKREEKNIIK